MTEPRVRELLAEVADAVPAPDVAERAWRRSIRVRRRRVAGTAVLAAGAVVAAVAVAGVIGDAGVGSDRVAGPMPVPEAASPRPPDAQIAGAPAWIGPSIEEEERLPRLASALPESIDLSADVETSDAPGRAVAAFAESGASGLDSVLLAGRDGNVSRLETPGLDPVIDDDGDAVSPLNISSLSPDGKRLAFAQQNSVVVYDLVAGQPKTCDGDGSLTYNVGWTADGESISLVKDTLNPRSCRITINHPPVGGYPPRESRFTVDGWFWPGHHQGERLVQTGYGNPPAAAEVGIDDPYTVTVDGEGPAALILPEPSYESGQLPCCRVASWLDPDTVAVESRRSEDFRVLGWDTTSGAVRLVSQVDLPDGWGAETAVSWADLSG